MKEKIRKKEIETKEKLKTNIINKKKEKKKYFNVLIIALLGILLTILLQYLNLKEQRAFNFRFKEENIVGIGEVNKNKVPKLPQGFEAINIEGNEYRILEDPYNTENFSKWNDSYYAIDLKENIWKWVKAFKFRTEYYKDDTLLGIATGPKLFDENKKEMTSSKDFEEKIKDANKYKYSVTNIDDEDPTYAAHPAFMKEEYTSYGFWVLYKPVELDLSTGSQLNDYNKVYNKIKNEFGKQENNIGIDTEMNGVNLLNSYEYGALKILNEEKFFQNTENENRNELILGYLDNGNDTYAKDLVADYKSKKNTSLPLYLKSEKNTPEENYIKATLTRGMYGDGFSETRGLLNKDTNKKEIDASNFLTTEKPFLILNKTKDGNKIKAINGKFPEKEKINFRLVINAKPLVQDKMIEHKFKSNEGYFKTIDGQTGTEYTYKITKGALITDEKLDKNIGKPERDGFEFVKWSPDPTGNIYYKNTEFTPVWKSKNENEYVKVKFYTGIPDQNGEIDLNEYEEVEVKAGEKVSVKTINEIEEKIKQKLNTRNEGQKIQISFENWDKDPTQIVINKEDKIAFTPKYIYENIIKFTFYKNAEKNEKEVLIAKYNIHGKYEGISPEEVPGYDEMIARLAPSDGTNRDYQWEPSVSKRQLIDTEYVPRFIEIDGGGTENPEDKEKVEITINYNGSSINRNFDKIVKVPKGTILSKSNDPEIKYLYEEMLSDNHKKINYYLPKDKSKWYNRSLDEPINENTVFKLNWQILEILVRFWNSPADNPTKKMIKKETIPAGGTVSIPEDSLVLPFYEKTNPTTGYVYKRTFNKIDGWGPKTVYERIYINSNGVKEENNRYVLDAYPKFQSEYSEKSETINIYFDINIPFGEEANIYFPDRDAFKDREYPKDSIFFAPRVSEYPRIPGYTLKGFSPKLPAKLNQDTTIKLIWEKNTQYNPVNPGPEQNSNNNQGSFRSNWLIPELTDPRNNQNQNNQKTNRNDNLKIEESNKKTPKPKTNVNVDTGLKINKNFVIIGSILTAVAIISYLKIIKINKQVKRNENMQNNIW